MNRLSRVATTVAATAMITASALAASAAAASASTPFGSCSAQGDYAICDASGTAASPVTITVTVTSSPTQSVYVSWTDTCSEGDGAGGRSGSFTATTPVSRTISHPYSHPGSCIVAAGAQLQAGGNSVHVSLSYSQSTQAPAPAPAIHEVRGYAGKCVADDHNSSARRTRIQISTCSGAASQQWSFSHGELRHASMCMNAKGTAVAGSPVLLWGCDGAPSETWTHNAAGEYVLKATGLCLDDPAYSTANGTQLVVYTCKDSANQRWSLP